MQYGRKPVVDTVGEARREHINTVKKELIRKGVPAKVADYVVNNFRNKVQLKKGRSAMGEQVSISGNGIVSYDLAIIRPLFKDDKTIIFWMEE